MIWELNKIQYPVYNLGPGKRIGIWVQGCSIRCVGCINRSIWENGLGKQVPIVVLFEIVTRLGTDYDGITITGGEPFDNYPQLMAFTTLIKRKTKLTVLCYSGYYLQELEDKFPDKTFYKCIDILIDGRYERGRPTVNTIKGSENQSCYSIDTGKATKNELWNTIKSWSLKFNENIIYMAGIPEKGELNIITGNLNDHGIPINFL
jgi:anaerobic ribonucleoside-triphosphate reductase activating protein